MTRCCDCGKELEREEAHTIYDCADYHLKRFTTIYHNLRVLQVAEKEMITS